MQVCIQDPSSHSTYFLDEIELERFSHDPANDGSSADVLFIRPGDTLVQELPPSRMTDSQTPRIQIVDPDRKRSWMLDFNDLQRFRVPAPPSGGSDMVWFAMPSAKDVLAAVPVFRRALVQHSS